ncbi:MAG: cell wall-binding repeat-containing protein [Actinobacteria bacterium]|nr:cell wall-binding repeat-containing protein [Actinomycetota bacterium]
MVSKRRLLSAAVLAGVIGATVPSAGSTQAPQSGVRVGPNALIGDPEDPLRGRDFPAIAMNPRDSRHLVLVDQDLLTGHCDFHTTFDGGGTWTHGHLTAPPAFTNPPCPTFDSGGYAHFNQSVAFGSGQNVYVTFASHLVPAQPPEARLRWGDAVLVAKSTDGGRTFGTAVVAIPNTPEAQPFFIRPGLAVEATPQGDRVYVTSWGLVVTTGGAGGGPGDRRAVTTRSDDGGVTWAPTVDAQAPGEQVRETTEPVIANDGTVYFAWRNRDLPPATNNITVGKSTDRGATWTQQRAGVVTGTGISANGGFPRMAIDKRSGALYLVYQGTNFGDLDVIFQRSTDGGATWSTPTRVNDDARDSGAQQLTPNVEVGADGRVHVVWFDRRGGFVIKGQNPASRGAGDVYYASSSDGGATFSPNRRVTDRSLNLDTGLNAEAGSYIWYSPEVLPVGDTEVLVAWADPRNGSLDNETQDIFWSRINLQPTGDRPTQRFEASNRVNFSLAMSQLAYPGGSEPVGRVLPSRIVVVGDDAPASTAVVGAALARGFYGPLLVTPAGGLTDALKDEVRRLRPGGVFVLGSEDEVSASVMDDLEDAGVMQNVVRLDGATPADTAKAAAEAMDQRTDEIKTAGGVGAFDTAVIVNPDRDEATTAAALAAIDRAPVLFTATDSLPAPTADALRALGIGSTLVIGGTESVSDAVLGQLPSPRRLGGEGVEGVSLAVARETVDRGLPSNIVYVTDAGRPFDQAVAGAAVGRLGGLMLAVPKANASRALDRLEASQPGLPVDRVVVATTTGSSGISAVFLVISALLAVAGLVLLFVALARKRSQVSVTDQAQDRAPRKTPVTGP